jgi:hypothetical protein
LRSVPPIFLYPGFSKLKFVEHFLPRCFGNFEDALGENDLWELSEKIKPKMWASSPTRTICASQNNNSSNNEVV